MTSLEDELEIQSTAAPLSLKQAFLFLAEEIKMLKEEIAEMQETLVQIQGGK